MSELTKEDLDEAVDTLRTEVDLKLGSLRAWGVAALLGGQALAGVLASVLAPSQTTQVAEAVLRHVPFI